MIAEDDLKSKDLPLPESYDSKAFGKFDLAVGDPFPDYEKDKDGKPVLGKDGKIQPLAFTLSYAGSDAVSGEGDRRQGPEDVQLPYVSGIRRDAAQLELLPSSRPASPF